MTVTYESIKNDLNTLVFRGFGTFYDTSAVDANSQMHHRVHMAKDTIINHMLGAFKELEALCEKGEVDESQLEEIKTLYKERISHYKELLQTEMKNVEQAFKDDNSTPIDKPFKDDYLQTFDNLIKDVDRLEIESPRKTFGK